MGTLLATNAGSRSVSPARTERLETVVGKAGRPFPTMTPFTPEPAATLTTLLKPAVFVGPDDKLSHETGNPSLRNASACERPAAIATMFDRPDGGVPPNPQLVTVPSVRSARPYRLPTDIAAMFETAVEIFVRLEPHARIVPSDFNAKEELNTAPIADTSERPAGTFVPKPEPQATTLPSSRNATECESPAATAITLVAAVGTSNNSRAFAHT